jgi:hypothetical protein
VETAFQILLLLTLDKITYIVMVIWSASCVGLLLLLKE